MDKGTCMYLCMYACLHVCVYACMRLTHVYMHACMHVCIYACTHNPAHCHDLSQNICVADLLDDPLQIYSGCVIRDLQTKLAAARRERSRECLRELRLMSRPKKTARSQLWRPGSEMLHLIPLGREFKGGNGVAGKQSQGPQKWFSDSTAPAPGKVKQKFQAQVANDTTRETCRAPAMHAEGGLHWSFEQC